MESGALALYGFDARTSLLSSDPAWPAERRAAFLLQPDVARPLSVDRNVWPAVAPARVTDGFAPDYWAKLDALVAACERAGWDDRSVTLVALSVALDRDKARALLVPSMPQVADSAWPTLGWDVADSGLISGLSDCGFLPGIDDVTALRRQFARRLNRHGLFAALGDACAFRAFCDARDPKHAPFLLHLIHRIPWSSPSRAAGRNA